MLIYKILRPGEWDQWQSESLFEGTPLDQQDGYVHCSTREQVPGTIERFFAGVNNLVIVTLDTDEFGDHVKWEDDFPHIYAALSLEDVVEASPYDQQTFSTP